MVAAAFNEKDYYQERDMISMITMIGTGHVFKIAEQVTFIVKYTWPDALLIELDEKRYDALMNDKGEKKAPGNFSKLYRDTAEYQVKMSEKNDAKPGGEMLAAIVEAKTLGSVIICIDKDAEQTMKEIEESMSCTERIRFSYSSFSDRMFGKRNINKTQKNFAADEEEYVRKMRKRFPTMVEKLIDERDAYMAEKIRAASEKYKNIVVVVGDAHVKGLCQLLEGMEIEKIRLADMLDQESMNRIKSRIWDGGAEAQ
jgi:pheromone shutdown protein TraB